MYVFQLLTRVFVAAIIISINSVGYSQSIKKNNENSLPLGTRPDGSPLTEGFWSFIDINEVDKDISPVLVEDACKKNVFFQFKEGGYFLMIHDELENIYKVNEIGKCIFYETGFLETCKIRIKYNYSYVDQVSKFKMQSEGAGVIRFAHEAVQNNDIKSKIIGEGYFVKCPESLIQKQIFETLK